jgi:hypothetical protein
LNGDKRGRAGGLNREARAFEVQFVRDASGQIVLIVGNHDLITTRGLERGWIAQEIAVGVAAGGRAGKDAYGRGLDVTGVTRVLQGFPGAFEEDALLGVENFGLARVVAEEGSVEPVGMFEKRSFLDVVRIFKKGLGHARFAELAIGEGV